MAFSKFSKCILVLSLVALASAQLSVDPQSAMKHWEREVKYDGLEKNAYQILKVMKAFAQHYVDYGVEPPRSKFNGVHYHRTWNRLRIDLRELYDHQLLATSFNEEKQYWFTCGLVYVRNTKKVGMCVSLKSLRFPPPCKTPVKQEDGSWKCPGIERVTVQTNKPFCCHRWFMTQDKCASCTDASSNGDQRNFCNKSKQNCEICGGKQFCLNSHPKNNSIARDLYKHRCCWGKSCGNAKTCTPFNHLCSHTANRCKNICGGSLFCHKNGVPPSVQTIKRVLKPAFDSTAATSGTREVVGDAPVSPPILNRGIRTAADALTTKSSIFFAVDSSPTTVKADGFFMRIIPVMPTGKEEACRVRALAAGGCRTLCCESQYRHIDFCRSEGFCY